MNSHEAMSGREDEGVAIIGMACRLPGAKDIEQFWQNLRKGVESILPLSDAQLLESGIEPAQLADPLYVRVGAALEDCDKFDASFFGYTPREAELLDPQQRLFHELAWQAIEDAGQTIGTYEGRVGVFAGSSTNTYLSNISAYPTLLENAAEELLNMLNEPANLATRLSYKLNLQGPSLVVETASSTSLSAICLACNSLLSYQCDMALAGGVSIQLPQNVGYMYQMDGIISPDGHCRTFDRNARGTVPGNGLGIVVLKRLSDALAEGDHIYAVIKGIAMNNDGARKVGFYAPGLQGQAEVIAEALALADIEPETVGYVEAHGTGTQLGDPIEVGALSQVFQARTTKKQFCALGSVKTNIGHLNAAAGVVGLIKTALILKHKEIPPSLHFQNPNPEIDFAHSPFYVNTTLSDWKEGLTPRRAGVSSFGIGGTNVHAVLEEAPACSRQPSASLPDQLLVLSAKSQKALDATANNLARYLDTHHSLPLADVAYTLQTGREVFPYRRAFVCNQITEAVTRFSSQDLGYQKTIQNKEPVVAFLFPGQGELYLDMGRELYHTLPRFREFIDECADILLPLLHLDIRTVLYPDSECQESHQRISQSWLAQPLLFVMEYALAQLWMSWGIQPGYMIGHSLGEYTAACLSGVLSLQDALKLVAFRGALSQDLPEGAMMAVALSSSELLPLLPPHLSLAAINGPSQCVVSGSVPLIERLQQQLAEKHISCLRLNVRHAWHSEMIDTILPAFLRQVEAIDLHVPQIPYISTVTGTWIEPEQATNPSYWARHFRQTVLFDQALETLLQDPTILLLEVGPGQAPGSLAMQRLKQKSSYQPLASLPQVSTSLSDTTHILQTLGKLWTFGVAVNWSSFHQPFSPQRLPLPGYQFERKRHWIEIPAFPARNPSSQQAVNVAQDLVEEPSEVSLSPG